jgi:signal peptidase I
LASKQTIDKQKAAAEPEKPKETTAEFISSMASVLVIGLFIITFCLQAFEIPSGSMEDTLLIGDHVFVDRVVLAPKTSWINWLLPYRAPKRGDIIVFLSPVQPGLYVVKRVIGQPGDRIHLREGVVYVNGQPANYPQAHHATDDYDPYRDQFPSVPPALSRVDVDKIWQLTMPEHMKNGEVIVPDGHYFGMGDNRDVSLDSRYWGFIPQENVVGRPMFIYWSFETPAGQWQKQELSDRIGFLFHIAGHFFTETRWSRMFHMVR